MSTRNTSSSTILRPDLAGPMLAFDVEANQAGFVGLDIAPVIEVGKPFGEYTVIPPESLLQERDTLRASDGTYNRVSGTGTTDSYRTSEHGLEELVDARNSEMYGDMWDSEALAAQRTRDGVLRNHNKRVITAALAVGTTTAAGNVWTGATGTPLENVLTACLAIRNRTGATPNAMVLDYEIARRLRFNPQIQESIWGSVNPKKGLSFEELRAAFDLEYLSISGGMKNTANEAKTAVLSSMWDKTKALVYVRSDDRDMHRPRFMNTFHWGGDGSVIGTLFEQYEDPSRRGDIIRHRMETTEKVVSAACAQLITGVAA